MRHTTFRSRLRAVLATTAAAAMMVGCSAEPEATPVAPDEPAAQTAIAGPQVAYGCDSGRSVSVAYAGGASARLTYEGKSEVLTLAASPSGARYVGAGLEWRTATQGGEEVATLSRLDPGADAVAVPLEQCRRPASAPETPPPCPGGQLGLTVVGGDAGMGNRVTTFAVRNSGPVACQVSGYPDVILLDAAGEPVAAITAEQNPGNYFNTGSAPGPVTLEPGGSARFDMAWTVVPNEAEGQTVCPDVARVRVRIGTGQPPVEIAQALSPCSGRIRISPFQGAATTPSR